MAPTGAGPDLRRLVPDGGTVAIGGVGLNRKPMALVRGLVASGARDLRIVSFLGSLDVELVLSAGLAAEIHTAGTALDGAGLAPRYRAARQEGHPRVVEWSEGSLAAALEAAARALDSMPCTTSPDSEVLAVNPHLVAVPDPFTGSPTTFAQALVPDLGLIQGSVVDESGNIHIDGDPAVEGLVARSARIVVASVLAVESRPAREAAVSRVWVDHVVVDPGSAWPTACHPGARPDLAAVTGWAGSSGTDTAILEPAAVP